MQRLRIIPTRVGTRLLPSGGRRLNKDHPHACGDKLRCSPLVSLSIGSSPRVWGQETVKLNVAPVDRIIPTRVGTSSRLILSKFEEKDHPHACGDKHADGDLYYRVAGSSPRVWGQVRGGSFGTHSIRIIPTRMGTRKHKMGFKCGL